MFLAVEANGFLYIIIYPEINIMCCVFLIYILQPTHCKLTAKSFSVVKTATKALSGLVDASISVICSCIIVLQSQYICLLQITQSHESQVYVLPATTYNTFKDAGALEGNHWYKPT